MYAASTISTEGFFVFVLQHVLYTKFKADKGRSCKTDSAFRHIFNLWLPLYIPGIAILMIFLEFYSSNIKFSQNGIIFAVMFGYS